MVCKIDNKLRQEVKKKIDWKLVLVTINLNKKKLVI